MIRVSLFSSSSVVNSRWVLAHSSFLDCLVQFAGMKSFTLSCRSTSDGLHGGLAFGKVHSVSSRIWLLTCVMQVVNLILRFVLYLLGSINGGKGGGDAGVGCVLWSGNTQQMIGWSLGREARRRASISSLCSIHMSIGGIEALISMAAIFLDFQNIRSPYVVIGHIAPMYIFLACAWCMPLMEFPRIFRVYVMVRALVVVFWMCSLNFN